MRGPRPGATRRHVGPAWLVGLGVLIGSCTDPERAAPRSPAPPPPSASRTTSGTSATIHPLEAVSVTASEDGRGQQHVSGQVRNVSAAPLDELTVQVWWFTDWLDLVTTREERLETDPLLPDATGAFDIVGPVNPYASKFLLEIRDAGGRTVLTVDRQ